jgi:hypothetical protein
MGAVSVGPIWEDPAFAPGGRLPLPFPWPVRPGNTVLLTEIETPFK